MRGVIEELQENRTTDSSAFARSPAGTQFKTHIDAVDAVFGECQRITQFQTGQMKSEDPRHVQELHVINRFDRNDMLVHIVGIGAVRNVVVVDGRIVVRICVVIITRTIERILIDLSATVDD